MSLNKEYESCHNEFYLAIRSGNAALLDKLINELSGKDHAAHSGEIDAILSQAFAELRLKNVPLSEKIEIFVENKLINLRFFSVSSGKDHNVKICVSSIMKRIELLLQSISLLKAQYSNTEKVDERFLFVAKFIARCIHVLKRQLKSTYDRVPWEEMEFCLVCFISSFVKQQATNVFHHVILSKSKILNHLENFAARLEDVQGNLECANIDKLTNLPNLQREEVVEKIISNHPQFEELYSDYQNIRDDHSLNKMSDYFELALTANPKEREGQLIITRVLQVIGEYLKNTLESPKLSSFTSKLLLLSLPEYTRKVLIALRNSLSHAYSLSKRTEIEKNAGVDFFIGVQNDFKKIVDVIRDILFDKRIKTLRTILKKIINCESFDELKEVVEILRNFKFDEIFMMEKRFQKMGYAKLESLIEELSTIITDKTTYEKACFSRINDLINSAKTKSERSSNDCVRTSAILATLSDSINRNLCDHNVLRIQKFSVNEALKHIAPKMESQDLKEIAILTQKIFFSAKSRIDLNNVDELNKLACELFYLVEFEMNDIEWIKELRKKMFEKTYYVPVPKQNKSFNETEDKRNSYLALKLSELENILRSNALHDQSTEKVLLYKMNEKLQTVVELLVLDILSILGQSEKYLENNLLFLDDDNPLIIGKCLRNHLAHDNTVLDILSSDPSIAVILNAKKLVSENIRKCKWKIGKLMKDDPSKLKDKFDQNLIIIKNQEKMFSALKEGDLEELKICLRKGADINARSINSDSTLHLAACGPSLEVVKFILDQKLSVNVKDSNGQSPLHIAAANGRKHTVEFFLRKAGACSNDLDHMGETPLHLASENGHKETVIVLLENNAKVNAKNVGGNSPLHLAVQNNHVEVAKILLEKEANVDANETLGGFTTLHIAAEKGYLELVNFLLKNGANVNARNDKGGIPLHTAALNGHLDVVHALIGKGADINCRVINGCTALHFAVENGHRKVVDVLLKYGANVNTVDKTFLNSPLHYAAKDGHEEILEALLTHEANASIATVEGMTPLHLAVSSGHLKIVAALLKHGVNIRARSKNNAVPLHIAADCGHKEVAELLLKNGAKISDKAINLLTPLHAAAGNGHSDTVELLLKFKAKIDDQDIAGSTPLHAAAMNGHKDAVDLLIGYRAEVNARMFDGKTPLHMAALYGHEGVLATLIKSGAEINSEDHSGLTLLHMATLRGHINVVNFLVKNKAKVNGIGDKRPTPLFLGVEGGHEEITQILIANGANVNDECFNQTPLLSAIRHRRKEIAKILIANGAIVNPRDGGPLFAALLTGCKEMVELLLNNKACVNVKGPDHATPLHLAATRGLEEIVSNLIKKGAIVDAKSIGGVTPLRVAAEKGNARVAEILIASNANVNVLDLEGAPIHIAAGQGHVDVVEVLIRNKANIGLKDYKSRTPLELAVAHGHLQVVKVLLQHIEVDLNFKCNGDWTILHIASQENNLEIIKFLVDEGCCINARNSSGSKPIHIAAREGHKDTVEFFVSKGLSIDEVGTANQTLLHYAAYGNQLEVVKYLIVNGADVNAKDKNGKTPLHFAAMFGSKHVVKVLLKHGAIYDLADRHHIRPLQMAENSDVINLLSSTKKLFESIKCNNSIEVKNDISAGAFVNARSAGSGTPLHYAVWKGCHEIVKILLQNNAETNAIGDKGFTPLHYAAKLSHLNIVKALLAHGAAYNALSKKGKTPLDFAVDKDIIVLLKLIIQSFEKVKGGNAQVINDLKKIKDFDTAKAVMNARTKENETLVVLAVHCNFSKVEQLKQVFQDDVADRVNIALVLARQGNYKEALCILRSAFDRRNELLGPNNPGTLDVQTHIAAVMYKQGHHQEALKIHEEIFQQQKETLGINNKDTLKTKSTIALVQHRLGKDEEALSIFQEVCQKQNELLGSNHGDTLDSQFHMALVLDRLGKYEEALKINKAVFEKRKKTFGAFDAVTVSAQNNIAMVLTNQGKYEEALKIYEEVLKKKKKILGISHADTLRTSCNIAGVLLHQQKYHEALKAFQEVLSIQKRVLIPNHPETLNTQNNIGNVLLAQGKFIGAFKAFRESLDQRIAVFGPSHPTILDTLKKIEIINQCLKFQGSDTSELLLHLQRDINIAVRDGDLERIQELLNAGVDVNDKDVDGRTPLHYAVNNGHAGIVEILLNNGADVTQVTNKGNTPLHTATSKCRKDIVETLLQHVSRDKLKDFIDAKTTSSGSTSLHVAAKNGSLEVVNCLLKHGAAYTIKNKEGKIPFDLSEDREVTNFLKLINELFEDVKNGNDEAMIILKALKSDNLLAVMNTRNSQNNTLFQVAVANKHNDMASKLLKILKRTD